MSNNNLTSIENDALGRLEMLTILYLDNNQLTQIPASLPSGLVKLYMHNNRITDIKPIDMINLINLELLDVSGNQIIFMPQLRLPALITLGVKSCGLENVHRQLPKTCPALRHLLIDGNLIRCSELMEIESCNENSQPLANEYINDDIDYNRDDVERKERHLNSISYFVNEGGGGGKCRGREKEIQPKETVPNCWNEQKLITSFIPTNDPPATGSNDNKFQRQSTQHDVAGGRNEGNSSKKTVEINNNRKVQTNNNSTKMTTTTTTQPSQLTTQTLLISQQPHRTNEKMKNSKDSKLMKKAKLATLPVNVLKTQIAASNNDDGGNSGVNNKNLSLDAHQQKGLNNFVLTKIKQQNETSGGSSSLIAKIENGAGNHTTPAINRNLIDNVNGDYKRAKSSSTKLITANKAKAIKDNESLNLTNNSKSIDEAHFRNDNKSHNSVNGRPLSVPEGNNSGNESIEATDHQQHMPINHTLNGELSEKWNDIRSETINHPGLLIVVAVSVGVLFTFIVVYVYRCNFINSARRHHCQRRGSCESINEGRDVLNDNFNEETHSFTIETHNHCAQPLTAQPTAVNHCDLLPMDILNSTLSRSSADNAAHISMHLW
jgi:hypothetical protein